MGMSRCSGIVCGMCVAARLLLALVARGLLLVGRAQKKHASATTTSSTSCTRPYSASDLQGLRSDWLEIFLRISEPV